MLTKDQERKLSQIRREWQYAAGQNLIDANGSIGLLLNDVTKALDLSPGEQRRILGSKLYTELNGNK